MTTTLEVDRDIDLEVDHHYFISAGMTTTFAHIPSELQERIMQDVDDRAWLCVSKTSRLQFPRYLLGLEPKEVPKRFVRQLLSLFPPPIEPEVDGGDVDAYLLKGREIDAYLGRVKSWGQDILMRALTIKASPPLYARYMAACHCTIAADTILLLLQEREFDDDITGAFDQFLGEGDVLYEAATGEHEDIYALQVGTSG